MGWLGMISRRQFVKTSVLTSTAAIAERLAGGGIPAAGGMKPTALRFGVNFTPRKNWWYCWLDWDHAAIADDLAGIAGLGVDHIRIQCLWPFFQPGIANVSERALANLRSLLEEADRAGLDVEVTVLNGWMRRIVVPACVGGAGGAGAAWRRLQHVHFWRGDRGRENFCFGGLPRPLGVIAGFWASISATNLVC